MSGAAAGGDPAAVRKRTVTPSPPRTTACWACSAFSCCSNRGRDAETRGLGAQAEAAAACGEAASFWRSSTQAPWLGGGQPTAKACPPCASAFKVRSAQAPHAWVADPRQGCAPKKRHSFLRGLIQRAPLCPPLVSTPAPRGRQPTLDAHCPRSFHRFIRRPQTRGCVRRHCQCPPRSSRESNSSHPCSPVRALPHGPLWRRPPSSRGIASPRWVDALVLEPAGSHTGRWSCRGVVMARDLEA